jgi:hypothetical protein
MCVCSVAAERAKYAAVVALICCCGVFAQQQIPSVVPTTSYLVALGYEAVLSGYWGNGTDYQHSSCRWSQDTSVSCSVGVSGTVTPPYRTYIYQDLGDNCLYFLYPNSPLTMNAGCTNFTSDLWRFRYTGPNCGGPPVPQSAPSVIAQVTEKGMAGPESDVPRPDPSIEIKITDVGQPESPVRVFGSAYLYLKKLPKDRVMVWIEPLGLRAQNVSMKVITKMTIEMSLKEGLGIGNFGTYELDFTDPRYHAPLQPGEVWKQPFDHAPGPRTKMTTAEYERHEKTSPLATGHVQSVTFSDGTTYAERSINK